MRIAVDADEVTSDRQRWGLRQGPGLRPRSDQCLLLRLLRGYRLDFVRAVVDLDQVEYR
jgi:hypothetical protein